MKRVLGVTAGLLLGAGIVLVPGRQEGFPHAEHAGLFPTCVGCHAGVAAEDAARMVSVGPEDCAVCHDGARLDRSGLHALVFDQLQALRSRNRSGMRALQSLAHAHQVPDECVGLRLVDPRLSGSGLAYYHLFSEALANAGAALGLPAELAKALAAQTAFGAAAQQIQAGANFVELRTAVTSPNGTTAAAIAVFEQDQALRRLVEAAAQAAQRRAQELSQGA